MRSANDFYTYIMPSFRILNSQSPFILYLQKQMLDIMGGVHISDADKIKSMQILLCAALAIDAQLGKLYGVLLSELIQTIAKNAGQLLDEYGDQIERSQHYISDFLNQEKNETELTQMYGRKPWQLQDKNSPSTRVQGGLKKPADDQNPGFSGSELVRTKGDYGWEFPELPQDLYSQKFKEAVSGSDQKHVLILGAGYGTFAYSLLKASEHNNSEITVNDLSPEQMAIFKDNLPIANDSRVTIISGDFLSSADFPPEHFDLILMNNVMHFFKPEQVDLCLNRIYGWLKPGGSLTLTTCTPYWAVHDQCGTLQLFEQQKNNHAEWPGFIANLKATLEEKKHSLAKVAPVQIHNFDPDTLTQVLSKHGFINTRANFFAFPETLPTLWRLDGRENVGAITFKPK